MSCRPLSPISNIRPPVPSREKSLAAFPPYGRQLDQFHPMDAPDVKPPVGPVFGGGEAETTAQQQQQSTAPSRKRASFSRVVPEQGKKRVNYGKGDARRIMEEAVSLCEAMTLGYEVVFHGRRRSYAAHRPGGIDGVRYILTLR